MASLSLFSFCLVGFLLGAITNIYFLRKKIAKQMKYREELLAEIYRETLKQNDLVKKLKEENERLRKLKIITKALKCVTSQ